jgi:Ca-activated chloride channel family protein
MMSLYYFRSFIAIMTIAVIAIGFNSRSADAEQIKLNAALAKPTRASDRASIRQAIESIHADGNTALFAGVSKGAAEVRKFLDDKHVNRIILLSDGLAIVGPSSPSELEHLGQSLLKEKISVSTLGLGSGYNEDLMSSLAAASSGNHVFIENADNLIAVFNRPTPQINSVASLPSDTPINLKRSRPMWTWKQES